VVFYAVAGMGHRWPLPSRKPTRLVDKLIGPGTSNLDASRTIADFFLAHPKKR
jgi:poly(3-hydroxybutyrate) depolymerase